MLRRHRNVPRHLLYRHILPTAEILPISTQGVQRPYHDEYTSSRPFTEAKQHRAWLVLGWVTAWTHIIAHARSFYTFDSSYANVCYDVDANHKLTSARTVDGDDDDAPR